MSKTLTIASYLAIKEVWRNRGRFLLVAMVIALITLLVLFIAALGEGLGNGNREYISKLNAELVIYQAKSDNVIAASRLDRDRLAAVRRVAGVADAGMVGTSSASLILPEGVEPIKVALLGVEPGHSGEPGVVEGQQLSTDLASEVIIDRNTAFRSNLSVGDNLTVRVTQGTRDEFFNLRIVGVADGQQFQLQPSIFVPFFTWDRIRSKSEAEVNRLTSVGNVIVVKLENPDQVEEVSQRLTTQVDNIQTATISKAIQGLPGYSAQQSTLQTQGGFTLFIGILVIGGFFQIQILQKVAQIGVLKAIGAANPVVAFSSIIQIVLITVIGVLIGALLTFSFSLFFPPTVPIVFNGSTSAIAIIALLLIGPLGGLVSIRYAVQIEPLKALGLS
ncbi:MAG: ABC transporter permease [Anaerolineaceae bacterium]|jgi:putative ABC transport system permease protein|nr:ABC transporter permease [Anaerolineaceae bacterium]